MPKTHRSSQPELVVKVREPHDGPPELTLPPTWPLLDAEVLIGHVRAARTRFEDARRASQLPRPELSPEPSLYTLKAAANKLGVSYAVVRGMLRRGELGPVSKLGRHYRVPRRVIEAIGEGRIVQ